jgi:hypothetical protein
VFWRLRMHVTGCISAVKEERPSYPFIEVTRPAWPRPTAVVHEFLHVFDNLSNQHAPV